MYKNIKVFSLLFRAAPPCPALPCTAGQGTIIFIYHFFSQGRAGQGRARKLALWTSLLGTLSHMSSFEEINRIIEFHLNKQTVNFRCVLDLSILYF
jgi:hypothetical protein